MTSVELEQADYDTYDFVVKTYIGNLEYKELLRINYQSYINAYEEDDLRRYLSECADLEVLNVLIYPDEFIVFV